MALKGILWSFVFLITVACYIAIPTYLMFEYWRLLNNLVDYEGRPIYTLAFFGLFLYVVSLLIATIYLVACGRAIVQCRNKEEGLGISKGVKIYSLGSNAVFISFFVVWYLLFGVIAVFTWHSPY